MIDAMYYDVFAEEYVKEKDPYAPPERYCFTTRGVEGIYVDHWEDKDGLCMDVAYLADEYYTEEHTRKLKAMCERENFKPLRLRYFTLPAEKFDEYVKQFGLE